MEILGFIAAMLFLPVFGFACALVVGVVVYDVGVTTGRIVPSVDQDGSEPDLHPQRETRGQFWKNWLSNSFMFSIFMSFPLALFLIVVT